MNPTNSSEHDAQHPSESICKSCGICCGRSFFQRVPFESEDDPGLPAYSKFDIYTDNNKTYFKLPCPAQGKNMECTIYNDRPTICRQYYCKLFYDVEKKSTPIEEALSAITEAKTLVNQLSLEMDKFAPSLANKKFNEVMNILMERRNQNALPEIPNNTYKKLLLKFGTLQILLQKRFIHDDR